MSNKEFFKKQLWKYRKNKFNRLKNSHNCPDCECYGCYKTGECGTGCNNPYKQNYKNVIDSTPKDEKLWLIFFFKTLEAMKQYLPEQYDEERFERLFEEAYWTDPITNKKRWKDPSSFVNFALADYQRSLLKYNVDWKKIQVFHKPEEVHVCNYDSTGHDNCKWKNNCCLRSD